ncbi:hypothetical protein DITRI_Ditri01bG0050300 [Diplodiscus trichospermus]
MNRALPEMLQCSDMTVLERQRARLKWQQEQLQQQQEQQQSYFSELSGVFSSQTSHVQGFQDGLMNGDSVLCDVVMTRQVRPDAGLETAWPEFEKVDMAGMGFAPCGYSNGSGFDMNYAISRTSSCPPAAAEAVEVFPSCTTNVPTVGMTSEMANPPYLQFNPVQQVVSCGGVEMGMGINTPDIALRRTISAPVSIPDASFLDSSCFTQIQPSATWDIELQNLYNVAFDQGRSTPVPSQPFTVSIEGSDLKMEM